MGGVLDFFKVTFIRVAPPNRLLLSLRSLVYNKLRIIYITFCDF